jgi:hypothetical protein
LTPKHDLTFTLKEFGHGQALFQLAAGWSENKKADVVEHHEEFQHVGLVVNKPSGTARLLFNQSSGDFKQILGEAAAQWRHHVRDAVFVPLSRSEQ